MPDDIRKEIEAEMMAEILSNNRNDTNLVMDQNGENKDSEKYLNKFANIYQFSTITKICIHLNYY